MCVYYLCYEQDGFDCIDLSDNEIKKLENFPRLRRLRMLLLHNNHIAKFQDNLAESIANLEYLILTGNRIAQLSELDRLACFAKLDTLALGGNPVTKRKYYREYVIHKLPQLKVLDFKKIKPHVRFFARCAAYIGRLWCVCWTPWLMSKCLLVTGPRGCEGAVQLARRTENRAGGAPGGRLRVQRRKLHTGDGEGMCCVLQADVSTAYTACSSSCSSLVASLA